MTYMWEWGTSEAESCCVCCEFEGCVVATWACCAVRMPPPILVCCLSLFPLAHPDRQQGFAGQACSPFNSASPGSGKWWSPCGAQPHSSPLGCVASHTCVVCQNPDVVSGPSCIESRWLELPMRGTMCRTVPCWAGLMMPAGGITVGTWCPVGDCAMP